MPPFATLAPLLRWDGVHLVLELDRVERTLRHQLTSVEALRELRLGGHGDAIRVTVSVAYRGVVAPFAVDVAEIRLKHRHLGFRLRRPRALGGLPLPRRVIERVLAHLALDGITLVPGEGIVVVDLRRWLPPQLELSIRTVQASDRALHVWVGPGSLVELPGSEPLALAAGPSPLASA